MFAPYLAPQSPTEGDITQKLIPPVWMERGDWEHPLGTDRFGRDVLSRIIYGSRISLIVSLIAIGVAGTVGTALGLISGYRGGLTDAVLMRLTDIGLSLPTILIAVVLVAVSEPSFRNVILVIALLLWPRFARQMRGETLAIKEQDFVALAVVAGRSSAWIISRHIFPNVVPTLLVISTLQVGYVILLEGTLSFLGVGVPPPNPAWGLMIADGRGFLATAWWISFFPGLAMLLTVLAVNLMGDWLRDHLDPEAAAARRPGRGAGAAGAGRGAWRPGRDRWRLRSRTRHRQRRSMRPVWSGGNSRGVTGPPTRPRSGLPDAGWSVRLARDIPGCIGTVTPRPGDARSGMASVWRRNAKPARSSFRTSSRARSGLSGIGRRHHPQVEPRLLPLLDGDRLSLLD